MRHINPIVASNGFSRTQNAALHVDSPAIESQAWMQRREDAHTKPVVDANQLTSLNAMISYVAHHLGATEFRIERNLSDRFNVPSTKCLPSTSFDPAIRYLVDSIAE